MKQRGRITLETEETIVLHESSGAETRFCRECDADALMIAPRAAAAVSGLTEREVFRLVESGKIHFTENETTLVCLRSVGDLLKEITPPDGDVEICLLGE